MKKSRYILDYSKKLWNIIHDMSRENGEILSIEAQSAYGEFSRSYGRMRADLLSFRSGLFGHHQSEIELKAFVDSLTKFSDVLPQIADEMPESILLFESGRGGETSLYQQAKRFFLPKTMELYTFSVFNSSILNGVKGDYYPECEEFDPASDKFKGFDYARRKNDLSSTFIKPYKPEQIQKFFPMVDDYSVIHPQYISQIIKSARESVNSPEKQKLVEQLESDLLEIEQQRLETRTSLEDGHGKELRENVVSLYRKLSMFLPARSIPKHMEVQSFFVDKNNQYVSDKKVFFDTATQSLILVPVVEKRRPLGLGRKKSPDFSQQSVLSNQEWCYIAKNAADKIAIFFKDKLGFKLDISVAV